MIAKILKPTASFSGVLYSELKVDKGSATFCGAYNFPFPQENATTEMYIGCLEQLAQCSNKPVKNKQFHAIISAKGKEHDMEFLNNIARQWMEKMGYGGQPFLVYYHGDTPNNHVHIVSCRVDKNGRTIPAYMEGRRAGIAIRELMNENLQAKAAFDIFDVLNNYSFSTEAQFRLVLERRGWKVIKKNNLLNLVKYINQGHVSENEVINRTKTFSANIARIKQLRAIFHKYTGLPTDEFLKMMGEKFGVDIIFHTAKGHTKPYGYTAIDHSTKTVYKGGEILPIERIINPVSLEKHLEIAQRIIDEYINSNSYPIFSELKKNLYKAGYSLKNNDLYIIGSDTSFLSLDKDLSKHLKYNERLKEANSFQVNTLQEAKVLASFYYVRAGDINISSSSRNDEMYRDIVQNFKHDKANMNEYLKENEMILVEHKNRSFIIDSKNKRIGDVSGLGLEVGDNNLERYYDANKGTIDNFLDFADAGLFIILSGLFSNLGQGSESDGHGRDREEAKRKKRSLKR